MDNILFFECPWCFGPIEVAKTEINCGIFRHGIFKNGTQISPHAPKEECDKLRDSDEIFGCAYPFQITKEGDVYVISKCEYI